MTAQQLIERLSAYPPNTEVCIAQLDTDFHYGEIESITLKKINFSEEPCGKVLATSEAIVLSDTI